MFDHEKLPVYGKALDFAAKSSAKSEGQSPPLLDSSR